MRERLESAYQEFATTYFWKVRLYIAGKRLYSSLEFYEDLYGAARDYGLFPEALWAYFRMFHPGPMLVGKPLKRFV
jgi:hypothetical protein